MSGPPFRIAGKEIVIEIIRSSLPLVGSCVEVEGRINLSHVWIGGGRWIRGGHVLAATPEGMFGCDQRDLLSVEMQVIDSWLRALKGSRSNGGSVTG